MTRIIPAVEENSPRKRRLSSEWSERSEFLLKRRSAVTNCLSIIDQTSSYSEPTCESLNQIIADCDRELVDLQRLITGKRNPVPIKVKFTSEVLSCGHELQNPDPTQLLTVLIRYHDLLSGKSVKLFGIQSPAKRGPHLKTQITDEVIMWAIIEFKRENPFSSPSGSDIRPLIESEEWGYRVAPKGTSTEVESFGQRVSRLKKKYRL